MGTNYGQYIGRSSISEWPVTDVSGCVLWLDGIDSNTICNYNGTIIGWRSKNNITYNLIKESDMTLDWWDATTRLTSVSNYIFDNQIVTRVKVTDNLDHFLWLLLNTTKNKWLKTNISFYIPSGNSNVDGIQIRYGNTLLTNSYIGPILNQWHDLELDGPMIGAFNDVFIAPLKGSGAIFVANENLDDDIFYIRTAIVNEYNGYNVNQISSANRPIYEVSTGKITHSSTWLDGSTFINDLQYITDGTFFWVGNQPAMGGTVYRPYGITNNASTGYDTESRHHLNLYTQTDNFSVYNNGANTSLNNLVMDSKRIIAYTRKASWSNGNKVTFVTDYGFFGDITNLDTFQIGKLSSNNSAGTNWSGDTYAMIIYDRRLSDKEVRMVNAHLNSKYKVY